MNECPFCEKELEVVDVSWEGFDINGCSDCDYSELDKNEIDPEMAFFI